MGLRIELGRTAREAKFFIDEQPVELRASRLRIDDIEPNSEITVTITVNPDCITLVNPHTTLEELQEKANAHE